LTVVSGMAWGIDRQAHQAALEGAGGTVAVLGTGLDQIYPRDNEDLHVELAARGLMLTEYAPETRPKGENFPRRNRIISGLSLGVLLVEAPLRSGGRITTRLALEQGREVYVVAGPEGRSTFAGCRELMEQGARAVTSAGEIILDLAPLLHEEINARESVLKNRRQTVDAGALMDLADTTPAWTEKKNESRASPLVLNDEERAVIEAISIGAGQGVHIDVLGRNLGWSADKTSRTLLTLEVRGLVTQLPGMCYTANQRHV
jgi:DNA processing protein